MSDVPKVRDLVGIAPGLTTEKEARRERERALQAEVGALRAKVTRLQDGIREADRQWSETEGHTTYTDVEIIEAYGLHPGDLDPEPHAAASETEAE